MSKAACKAQWCLDKAAGELKAALNLVENARGEPSGVATAIAETYIEAVKGTDHTIGALLNGEPFTISVESVKA